MAQDNPSNNCAKLKLIPCPSLVLLALLLGVCRASLGQGDANLEAPGSAPYPTTLATGNITLFQNVRIFDGKTATLSGPSNVLVDGDPIANIKLVEDPAKNFVVIMKDGRIYKNTLK